MPLNVSQQERSGHRVLAVAGELDLETAATLVNAALAELDSAAPDVVIDAHELSFCDSSGLSAFVRISNRVAQDGGRLAIAAPHAMVSRVLEISGLVEAFVVTDSLDEAFAALDRPSVG